MIQTIFSMVVSWMQATFPDVVVDSVQDHFIAATVKGDIWVELDWEVEEPGVVSLMIDQEHQTLGFKDFKGEPFTMYNEIIAYMKENIQ